jgi:hypothetical protein
MLWIWRHLKVTPETQAKEQKRIIIKTGNHETQIPPCRPYPSFTFYCWVNYLNPLTIKIMTVTTFKEQLLEIRACEEAVAWVGDKTLEQAWNECHRGDWMLWIYRRSTNYNLQTLTLAKGHCANTVRHLMKDERSKKAVDVAIAFGKGNATHEELNADATYAAAAYAAYAAAAAAAAYAAYADAAYADAAYAAYAAAADAAYAAAAADAAAYAAAADAAYAAAADADRQTARKDNQQATADICRKYLPIPVLG